jgi:mRNA interferase RelE/StbE
MGVRYEVVIERKALKSLQNIPAKDRTRIETRIEALADDPRPTNATPLVGTSGWRIRQGDYRIVYEIADTIQIVSVIKIEHRRSVYRR